MLQTMTSQHLPVSGLSPTEEAKVFAMLQGIGTTPTDFILKLLKTMARTGVVPLLVEPTEKTSDLSAELLEAERAKKLQLASIDSLGIPFPHQCKESHVPNKETGDYLLLPDSEKEYETFSSFEEWLVDMRATIKQP